jgi:hypothetical protein
MRDNECDRPMAGNTAKPRKRGQMAIDDRDQQVIAWHGIKQLFDMAARLAISASARPLGRVQFDFTWDANTLCANTTTSE